MKRETASIKRRLHRSGGSGIDVWGFCSCLSLVFGLAGQTALGLSLQIEVTPKFSAESIQLDSMRYLSSAGERLSLKRVSYLLSGFALEHPDGTWLELTNQFAWLDAEN